MQLAITDLTPIRARSRKSDPSIFAGAQFQRFTLVAPVITADGRTNWLARCECGTEKVVRVSNLRRGHTVSCGCLGRKQTSIRTMKHGHGTRSKTPTYRTWQHMIERCHSPTCESFPLYGGRGIFVCDEWRFSFKKFLEDMGERPQDKTIDRIDVHGGYTPSNCRWATVTEQAQNTRRTKLNIETARLIRARKGSISSRKAASEFGVSSATIRSVWIGKSWRNA